MTMLVDNEVNNSFELDFEIYQTLNTKFKYYETYLDPPRLKSDDLWKEFENYISTTRETFSELIRLLNECNTQRMNFRLLLIKILKEKLQIDKLLKEEGDPLILKKLLIHDELKSKIIDKRIDQLTENQKVINNLKDQCGMGGTYSNYLKMDKLDSVCNMNNSSVNMNVTGITGTTMKSPIARNNYNNYTKLKFGIPGNNLHINSNSCLNQREKNSNSPMNISFNNTMNDSNNDSVLKKMLNLDFTNEKYGIISNSPIQTPSSKKNEKIVMNNNHGGNINSSITNKPPQINTQSNILKQKSFFSNSMSNTPNKKSINSSLNGAGNLMSLDNQNKVGVTNAANLLNANKTNSHQLTTERKINKNESKMKRYSKSIDFDSSYDCFHSQTQENYGFYEEGEEFINDRCETEGDYNGNYTEVNKMSEELGNIKHYKGNNLCKGVQFSKRGNVNGSITATTSVPSSPGKVNKSVKELNNVTNSSVIANNYNNYTRNNSNFKTNKMNSMSNISSANPNASTAKKSGLKSITGLTKDFSSITKTPIINSNKFNTVDSNSNSNSNLTSKARQTISYNSKKK